MAKNAISKTRKALLVKLESIIGNEFYNANIQNWGPGGVFEGEGREFRYPITFYSKAGEKQKQWRVDETMATDMIKGGYYACGANELHIMNALDKILTYLETEYELDIESGPGL